MHYDWHCSPGTSRIVKRRSNRLGRGVAIIGFCAYLAAYPALPGETPSPLPQHDLKRMLKVTWRRGPDLPQGFQDSHGGFLGSTLITVGGFCSGLDDSLKPGHYPRGFLKKAWGLDLMKPARGWVRLPDFPGDARQGLSCTPVGQALYCWGGFSYSAPYTYEDGYRLSKRRGQWTWDALPPLPSPTCASGLCAVGTRIYASGGADYDANKFYTETDRAGGNPRLGARLLTLDTQHLGAGWKRLADCPGTPRWVHAVAAADGKIYVMGGATGERPVSKEVATYCTVVDNWRYDPGQDKWTRIRDLPVSSGNFPAGNIAFHDRYLVLVGGYQYAKVAQPDGTIRDKYGTASRFDGKGDYFNDVFVYDTKADFFGTADPLPINNNQPMAVVRGDEVFLIGGEADARVIDGEYYGHHPDLLLQGKISEYP